jgi:hypothetical protein
MGRSPRGFFLVTKMYLYNRCDISKVLWSHNYQETHWMTVTRLSDLHHPNKAKAVPLHATKALGGERRYSSYSFSTSTLDGGEWSASRPGLALALGTLIPGKGGWVGPRAGLDTEARGKILCLCRGSNLDRPVVQPVARHYTDWATRLTLHHLHFVIIVGRRYKFTVVVSINDGIFEPSFIKRAQPFAD